MGVLTLGAFVAAAAAGRPGGPACLDQAAAEALAEPGFVTYTDSLSPACVRIRLG